MKPSLQFRLSQHLTLTPQLQQSIRLLQLSTIELNQEIERMLMQNPILEREDGDDDTRPPAGGGNCDAQAEPQGEPASEASDVTSHTRSSSASTGAAGVMLTLGAVGTLLSTVADTLSLLGQPSLSVAVSVQVSASPGVVAAAVTV